MRDSAWMTYSLSYLGGLQSRAGLIAVVGAALLAGCTLSGGATQQPLWTDAFQSSAATFVLDDRVINNLPAEIREPARQAMALPPRVTGTLRFRAPLAVTGSKIRVRFTNEDGEAPLELAAASAGIAGVGFDAQPGDLHALTFGGASNVSIPAGAVAISDPVDLAADATADLLVSVYIPKSMQPTPFGGAAMMAAPGNATLAGSMPGAKPVVTRPFVSGVSVAANSPVRVIVALGDSITDGNRAAVEVLRGWPEALQKRLRTSRPDLAIVNAGIGGNRVLANEVGVSALGRLERDVLRVQGLAYVVVLEGINDIGSSGTSWLGPQPDVSADDLIAGYRQIIARAHERNARVVGGTIMPFEGAMYYSPEREATRQTVNAWIRSSGAFDGVIDFDLAMRDPAAPRKLRAEYDSGDHLHPNDRGYQAMGDSIDLMIFSDR